MSSPEQIDGTRETSQQRKMSNCEGDGKGSSGERWRNRQMNPHLETLHSDFLYHIGYSREEAKAEFGNVKVSRITCSLPAS